MISLTVGIALTLLAWLGLIITVLHGKYVTDKIGASEYHKGPFKRRSEAGGNGEEIDRGGQP